MLVGWKFLVRYLKTKQQTSLIRKGTVCKIYAKVFTCMVKPTPVFGAYKPVAKKVKPVKNIIPEDARVHRQFPEDPMLTLPPLQIHPPMFTPTTKLTLDRLAELNINSSKFLWPEEEKLFTHIYSLNEHVLAFEESD